MLNLTHRESHETPQELEPDKFYNISINLDGLGQKVSKGKRLVVALSPTDWPQAWPSSETPNISLDLEHSLRLPLYQAAEFFDIKLEAPEIVQPIDREIIRKESPYSRSGFWRYQ